MITNAEQLIPSTKGKIIILEKHTWDWSVSLSPLVYLWSEEYELIELKMDLLLAVPV